MFHYHFHVFNENFCLHRFLCFQRPCFQYIFPNCIFPNYITYSLEYGIKYFCLLLDGAPNHIWRFRILIQPKISFLSQIATLTDRIEELEAKIKINTNYERRLERLESRLGVDSENHLDAQIFNDMVWTRALWSQIGRPTCLVRKLTIESR